uniref:Putative ixostatin n=1 Tax=Ixodes ricinus TaxID=34613 RepID=A0A0K8R4F3_IXORI
MISTRVVLVFAALALAYIAGEKANLPYGCRPVSENSFKNPGQTAGQRPPSPAHALGEICKSRLHKDEKNINCIGDAGVGMSNCTMCCVCKRVDGNIYYNGTTAPNNFPCGPRKSKKKCNPRGVCTVSN